MSFVIRDFLTPVRMLHNMRLALYRQFEKAFGKTTIDGVEVYGNKLILWNGAITTDPTAKRFLNKIGFEFDKLKSQNYSGVEDVFMTFDSKKYAYEPLDKEEIRTQLLERFEIGQKFSIKVVYGAELLRYFTDHNAIINDINYLINKLDSDPKKYYASTVKIESEVQQPWDEFYVQKVPPKVPVIYLVPENQDYETLALLDDNSFIRRNGVREVQYKTHITSYAGKLVDEISLIYDYEVIALPEDTNNQLVNYISDISNILKIAADNINISEGGARSNLNYYYSYTSNSLIKKELLSWQNYDSSIFYNNHLRVDAVKIMNKKEFLNVLNKTLIIDYTEKKVAWWKKLIGFLIIVVSLQFGFAAGGVSSLGASGGFFMANQIATTLMVINMSLGVGMLLSTVLLGKEAMASMIKVIGGVMQMTGLLSSFLGAYSFATSALKNGFGMGMSQMLSGIRNFSNLFSFFGQASQQEMNPNETDTQNKGIITASEIELYKEIAMENDALLHTSIIIEKNLGGTMTEIVKKNQAV